MCCFRVEGLDVPYVTPGLESGMNRHGCANPRSLSVCVVGVMTDVTPVRRVGPVWVLELFHGPTFAFKDVALQVPPTTLNRKIHS